MPRERRSRMSRPAPGAPRTPQRCLTSLARIFAAARGAKSPASARGRRSANIQLAPELALTTSTNCCGSRPARTASASASAPAARFTAASRLLTILNLAAVPGASPTRNTRPATASNTGSQRATAVGGAGDHHGHGAVGGAARTAGDRRVDQNDAVRGEAVRQRAGVVGRHRRREHDDRAGSKCRCRTVGAEEDVVRLSRVDDQHDRDVAGACQRCGDWDGRWHPAILLRRGPRADVARMRGKWPRSRLASTPMPMAPMPMTPTAGRSAFIGPSRLWLTPLRCPKGAQCAPRGGDASSRRGPREAGIDGNGESAREADSRRNEFVRNSKEAEALRRSYGLSPTPTWPAA